MKPLNILVKRLPVVKNNALVIVTNLETSTLLLGNAFMKTPEHCVVIEHRYYYNYIKVYLMLTLGSDCEVPQGTCDAALTHGYR